MKTARFSILLSGTVERGLFFWITYVSLDILNDLFASVQAFCYAFNGNLNTLQCLLRRLTLARYHVMLSLIIIGEAWAMTRTSLWINFDGIKVAVHPPHFRHGNGFQVRTDRIKTQDSIIHILFSFQDLDFNYFTRVNIGKTWDVYKECLNIGKHLHLQTLSICKHLCL